MEALQRRGMKVRCNGSEEGGGFQVLVVNGPG